MTSVPLCEHGWEILGSSHFISESILIPYLVSYDQAAQKSTRPTFSLGPLRRVVWMAATSLASSAPD